MQWLDVEVLPLVIKKDLAVSSFAVKNLSLSPHMMIKRDLHTQQQL
jgi:hypothetical protein